MSEQLAGFGSPAFLPLSVRRAQADEERREAQAGRQRAAEFAERVERRRSEDLTMFAAEAERRGEYVDPVALATGHVTGHSLASVLAAASARADAEDARAESEARRNRGEAFAYVGELEPPETRKRLLPDDDDDGEKTPAARSAALSARRAVQRKNEAFVAAVEARRKADGARTRLEDLVPSARRPWRRGR